ncbi:putative mitochondrial protein [Phytophthora megakarya]|uniref:Putative mitochondrial protein n=1 Tax=Phytophthora megakarya TaxID=4795 RepID=A0A225UFX5_9STRA|nr:putative mitochondrial protein [Phytophthora megakarya]
MGAAKATLDKIIQAPLNIKETRASRHWAKWKEAIKAEIQALPDNDTFELVDPPPGANVIGSMIAFRVKQNENGSVERLKARVCAQGFTQEFLKD